MAQPPTIYKPGKLNYVWNYLNRTLKDFANALSPYLSKEIEPLPFKTGSVGSKVSFTKPSYSNPYAHRDVIIPGVLEIARNNNGGLYNAALESSYNGNGPLNTEWTSQFVDPTYTSWAPLWDIASRTYVTWINCLETPEGSSAPPLQVGMHMIMHETTTNRYWLMMFTHWSSNNSGGGFAYDRYEIYPEVTFEKPDYQTEIVDKLSDGVWIARADQGPLYNAINEKESIVGQSPYNTRWNSQYTDSRTDYSGFTDLSNLESRVYTDFTLALDYNVGNNILGTDLIMHDLTTDLYYKVQFDAWTSGGNGGGFIYRRTVIPQSKSIKFADGTIINTNL